MSFLKSQTILNHYTLDSFCEFLIEKGNLFKENDEKREQLLKTIDELKIKYGTLSVMRALSMTEASTLKLREGLIAGHKR